MKLRHLCLLLLAVVACVAAQSEDDIPVENDNQFPPDNIAELEGNVLNEPEETVEDITTQPSDVPTNESTLSTTDAVTLTTEAANTEITTETSIPPVEDTQTTNQEDVVDTEGGITNVTTEPSVDAENGLAVTEISTSEEPVNEDVTTEINTLEGSVNEDVTTEISILEGSVNEDVTTEISILEGSVNEDVTTEISILEGSVNEDNTTETSTPLIEDLISPEPEEQAIVVATSADPFDTVSTEPTVTQAEEAQMSTTELSVAISEIDTIGEPIDPDTTDLIVAVDQEEAIDVTTTESTSMDEDVAFPISADETDVGTPNDSAIGVAQFSVLLDGDGQLPTTEVNLRENSEAGSSTGSVFDVTTESSVLAVDEQLSTDDSVVKESTDLVSSIEPFDASTTEAFIPLSVNVELPTTELEEEKTEVGTSETSFDRSFIDKNNLQTTETNEESLVDGSSVTPVSPIDPSEFSIRSNKARNDLEAISPLTLAEAPKEVVAPQEVDLPKDTKVDNKEEDVSVGATTSVNNAGGIDKSVIGVIVAGMVVVVAGITIKKNWKSIKNKFSSSPRPANDRTNHTNGIAPEEVPLQDKDNKNPSPV